MEAQDDGPPAARGADAGVREWHDERGESSDHRDSHRDEEPGKRSGGDVAGIESRGAE